MSVFMEGRIAIMSFLRSMPEASLMDVFKAYPGLARPIHEFAETLMRGPSPFSEGERELIAAYVSSLNGCHFCRASHMGVATRFGIPERVLNDLLADSDHADISEKFKPIIRYVRKLTETPARMDSTDVEKVYEAGWDKTALVHAALVCAFFSLMNRWVDGLGIQANSAVVRMAADMLHKKGYEAIHEMLAHTPKPENPPKSHISEHTS